MAIVIALVNSAKATYILQAMILCICGCDSARPVHRGGSKVYFEGGSSMKRAHQQTAILYEKEHHYMR